MAGRPINEERATAITLGYQTYLGSEHSKCGTNERYTKGGGCVYCARVVATEQRDARKFLQAHQTPGDEPLDTGPEVDIETEDEARRRIDESIEDLM